MHLSDHLNAHLLIMLGYLQIWNKEIVNMQVHKLEYFQLEVWIFSLSTFNISWQKNNFQIFLIASKETFCSCFFHIFSLFFCTAFPAQKYFYFSSSTGHVCDIIIVFNNIQILRLLRPFQNIYLFCFCFSA